MRMSGLEELKSREREVDFLLGGTRFREDWDWLIKQAERVQELEKQNKRYREAINNIIEKTMSFGTNEEVYEAIQDALKASENKIEK